MQWFFQDVQRVNRHIINIKLDIICSNDYLSSNPTFSLRDRAAAASLAIDHPVSIYHVRQAYRKLGIKKKKVLTNKMNTHLYPN